jgi:hypothetical protein
MFSGSLLNPMPNLSIVGYCEFLHIGCPTSGITQSTMREAAPHAHGVSKASQV